MDESMNRSRDTKESSGENYKTELCRTWVEKNYCPYREKCRFAHGKKDLHDKVINSKNYKQKECMSFYQKGFCPYGPRCHFKHEERKLNDVMRAFYPFLLNSKNTLEKLDSVVNQKNKSSRILFSLAEAESRTRPLKAFESLRTSTQPCENFKLFSLEDIKSARDFILPRKVFDSYM